MRILATIVVLSTQLLLIDGACQTSQAAAAPVKLLFANGGISNSAASLWIAKDQAIFLKYGIDADPVFIIGGRAAQAMLAGQVPVGLITATHAINAVTSGGDLVMLVGIDNSLGYSFVARPEIKSAEDLKGKKVGTATPGGSATLSTYIALDYLGLVPRRDNVVVVQIGGEPDRVAALRTGTVAATSLSQEYIQPITAEGYRVLLDTSKENIPFQATGLITSRRLIKSDPQLIENVVRAILEGVAFIHNPANKKVVEQTLAKYLRLDKPERVEKAYQNLRKGLSRKPCPTIPGVASVIKLMAQHGINAKAAQLKPEDVVDMSFCKRLEESAFIDRLYQGF
jgi:NitT/TauT family transport system substrate-binding protein